MTSSCAYMLVIIFGVNLLAVNSSEPQESSDIFMNTNRDLKVEDGGIPIKRPFFIGSRYGRSPSQQYYDTKTGEILISPRNDRFFLGSRYGKRSNDPLNNSIETNHIVGDGISNVNPLLCKYTGFQDYFRCNSI